MLLFTHFPLANTEVLGTSSSNFYRCYKHKHTPSYGDKKLCLTVVTPEWNEKEKKDKGTTFSLEP